MSSVIRNFIVTFCVSLLIFGLLSYAIVTNVENVFSSPDDRATESGVQTEPVNKLPGSETEGNIIEPGDITDDITNDVTILLVGTDYQPDILKDYDVTEINKDVTGFPVKAREITADAIMLLKIDGGAKEFVFSMLPSDMRVQADGNDVKLGSLYASKGIHYMRNKVTAMTGLKIDYYAVISVVGLASVIDELGGINVTVPTDMNYDDESQQLYIHINKGSQTLGGTDAVNMLRYKLYPNGDTSRRSMIAAFARAMLKKMTDVSNITRAPDIFTSLSKYVETDFTLADLALHLDLILAYPDYTASDINYPGTAGIPDDSFGGDTYFEPDINAAISLYRKYR
ncbi:MAG: LCP family protein [Eubacteriales bacterium]|nr:LCP family protein [Eubacteriales bacterium]